jgi:hypothetical protein
MKYDGHMKRISLRMLRRILVFGFGVSLACGTGIFSGSGGWTAFADPPLQQKRSENREPGVAAPAPIQPRKVPEESMPPEKKKTPYKEFVPSERIEPDHAVDFPADI